MSETPLPSATDVPESQTAPLGALLPSPLPRPVVAVELIVVLAAMYLLTVLPRAWLNYGLDFSDRWWRLFAMTRSGAVDCVLLVLLAIILLRMRGLSLRWLGLSQPALGRQFFWAIVGVACVYGFQLAIVAALHWLSPVENSGPEAEASPSDFVYDLVSTPHKGGMLLLLLVSAIREELLFRALILRYLTWLVRDPPIAVIVSSLLFAAPHWAQGGWAVAGSMWLGLVVGTLYERRGSLLTAIAVHYLFNVLQSLRLTLLYG
jgi:membrane protease YdiL (CAAX protease family)